MQDLNNILIIHLSTFSDQKQDFQSEILDDEYYVSSWAGLIAHRLKKLNHNLNIEIWRAEHGAKKPLRKVVYDIVGVIWPYRIALVKNILTLRMYLHLLMLCNKYDYIILHFHSVFSRISFIKWLLPGRVKLIISHHGGIPPAINSFKAKALNFSYRRTDGFTYLTPATKEFLFKMRVPSEKMIFLPVGADFSQFRILDKMVVRKKLGLDLQKIYAIYVGKFYKLKSVDLIIEIYNRLKSEFNFSVIFVGGENNNQNDLYDEVVKSSCPFFGFVPWTDMVYYYNAADFYIHPAFHPAFGGLDVAWMEALACNIPVLSPQLGFLDFDTTGLGMILKSENDVFMKTSEMIQHHTFYSNCREIAKNHLDGNNVLMEKLIGLYQRIT